MRKILVMTDLHILPEGETIIGLDPSIRLRQTLAHAALHQPDADRLILMGDLTHHGDAAAYARLATLLVGLPWPVSLMIGNHDCRDAFRAAFPGAPADTDGFVQSTVDSDDLRLILLDSVEPGIDPTHAGILCDARMAWLDGALSTAGQRACLVFLHHPPFVTGFDGMDRIGLSNAAALRHQLQGASVRHVFAGHVHRNITATVGGISMTVFKSPCHQMPLQLGASTSGASVDEPPGYGILLWSGEDIVVHFADVIAPAVPSV